MNYRIEKLGDLYFSVGSPSHEDAIVRARDASGRERVAADELRSLRDERDALRSLLAAKTVELEQLRQERERDRALHDLAEVEQREQWRKLARTRRRAL